MNEINMGMILANFGVVTVVLALCYEVVKALDEG